MMARRHIRQQPLFDSVLTPELLKGNVADLLDEGATDDMIKECETYLLKVAVAKATAVAPKAKAAPGGRKKKGPREAFWLRWKRRKSICLRVERYVCNQNGTPVGE